VSHFERILAEMIILWSLKSYTKLTQKLEDCDENLASYLKKSKRIEKIWERFFSAVCAPNQLQLFMRQTDEKSLPNFSTYFRFLQVIYLPKYLSQISRQCGVPFQAPQNTYRT